MTDIRVINVSNLDGIWADWLLKPNNTLDESEELANIVKVALLTFALAAPDDILPDPELDRPLRLVGRPRRGDDMGRLADRRQALAAHARQDHAGRGARGLERWRAPSNIPAWRSTR